jgi:hypothetical protein
MLYTDLIAVVVIRGIWFSINSPPLFRPALSQFKGLKSSINPGRPAPGKIVLGWRERLHHARLE